MVRAKARRCWNEDGGDTLFPAVEVCDWENPFVIKFNASEMEDCVYLSGNYLSFKLMTF